MQCLHISCYHPLKYDILDVHEQFSNTNNLLTEQATVDIFSLKAENLQGWVELVQHAPLPLPPEWQRRKKTLDKNTNPEKNSSYHVIPSGQCTHVSEGFLNTHRTFTLKESNC